MEIKKFAVLDGENIVNIVMAESKSLAEELFEKTCIEIDNESLVDMAWKFNIETQEFYLPEAVD